MPMQPLSRVRPDTKFSFAWVNLTLRPKTLQRIGKSVALWSMVEAELGQLLAFALKGDPKAAVGMYLSLTSSGGQNAALKAATDISLSPKHLELFHAIWTIVTPLARERNKLAHWVWGYSAEIKNALLLLDPKDGLSGAAASIAAIRNREWPVSAGIKPSDVWVVR